MSVSVEERLYGLINYERGFAKYNSDHYTPGKVGDLLRSLEIPFEELHFVHIAGTKGKGSTAHYVAELLIAGGKKVGLFTSPHLFSVCERIRINGNPISHKELDLLLDEFETSIREAKLTFFDALTFLATVYFYRKKCEWIVFETGLGGRLDSTNFINPKLAIITPISKDHTALLGHHLTDIAREKAGIIKKGIPVLSSIQPQEALAVICEESEKKGSELILFEKQIFKKVRKSDEKGSVFDAVLKCKDEHTSFDLIHLHQIGRVFVDNFLLASLAVLIIGEPLTPQVVHQASSIQILGRMQLIESTLFDVSHNGTSIEELLKTLSDSFSDQKINLMIGVIQDKEIHDIASVLLKYSAILSKIQVFDFEHPRKSGGKALYDHLKSLKQCTYVSDLTDLSPEQDMLNVLTGSFYTIEPYIACFLPQGKKNFLKKTKKI